MAEGKDGNKPGLSDLAQTGHRRATSFVGEPRTTRFLDPIFFINWVISSIYSGGGYHHTLS